MIEILFPLGLVKTLIVAVALFAALRWLLMRVWHQELDVPLQVADGAQDVVETVDAPVAHEPTMVAGLSEDLSLAAATVEPPTAAAAEPPMVTQQPAPGRQSAILPLRRERVHPTAALCPSCGFAIARTRGQSGDDVRYLPACSGCRRRVDVRREHGQVTVTLVEQAAVA